jgi:putative oxidoreductase
MNAKLVMVLRVLFGLHFLLNGLNFFWHFFNVPPPQNPLATQFMKAMVETGVVFSLVKTVEVVTGVALLVNRFVPLALVVALPVSVNVFLIDVFLIGTWFGGYVLGGGTLLLNLVLLLAYLKYYRPMLSAKADL